MRVIGAEITQITKGGLPRKSREKDFQKHSILVKQRRYNQQKSFKRRI